jgi:hypothetical protein
MDLTSELPFWTIRNGLMAVYPPLERDLRCDALIVGGALEFGGNGITFSQIASRVITGLFTGTQNQDARVFGFERLVATFFPRAAKHPLRVHADGALSNINRAVSTQPLGLTDLSRWLWCEFLYCGVVISHPIGMTRRPVKMR